MLRAQDVVTIAGWGPLGRPLKGNKDPLCMFELWRKGTGIASERKKLAGNAYHLDTVL